MVVLASSPLAGLAARVAAPRRAAAVAPRASQASGSQHVGAASAAAPARSKALGQLRPARSTVTRPTAPVQDAPARAWYDAEHPPNMVRVDTLPELNAVLRQANENGRSRLVVVEFIAGHCAACRALYPKLCRMASDEFPTVQFVKVLGDVAVPLAQACGVDRFPLFQFFVGSHGKVAEFSASMSSEGLARLRLALRHHSTPRSSLVEGQKGPASILQAPGWPALLQ